MARLRSLAFAFGGLAIVSCSYAASDPTPTPAPSSATATDATAEPTTPAETPVPSSTPAPTPLPSETPVPAPAIEPVGFPLGLDVRTGLVTGEMGDRVIEWDAGPSVRDVSETWHPSDDPVQANAAGWNCRVHVEYEGLPAVDWYVPEGTAVYATMDGTATLYMNTVANAFDYWAVSREPYIGDPDRANAPLSPFPGPGGGQGVFVRVENSAYRTDYGHLFIDPTAQFVPSDGWIEGFSPETDWAGLYGVPRNYLVADPIARWEVRAGDLLGYTGDAGYSEAPHLHYTITEQATGTRLCPTDEPGFEDAGWLWR